MAEQSLKQLAAAHRRSLKAMHKKVSDMAALWWDQDECCRSFLNELAEKIEQTESLLVIEETDENGMLKQNKGAQ